MNVIELSERETFVWRIKTEDFSGGPVVKILHFYCRMRGFNPWSEN